MTRELPASVRVPAAWNGPAASANGGIAAGIMAAFVDGPAEVRLSSPPPLGADLGLERDGAWTVARRADGEQVLRVRAAAPPEVEVPDVDLDAVSDGVPFPDHPAVTCVVCGVDHPEGLEMYPAPVAGSRGLLATWWTPPDWSIDGTGHLRPELQWGVLDCPAALAIMHEAGEPTFAALAGITGEVLAPVRRGERVLVVGFTIAADGRKHSAGTAILRPDGELLAHTRQLCITVPPAWATGTS